MTMRSAFYRGEVVHDRSDPRPHRLRYRVFSMLFDLDEVAHLHDAVGLFAYNTWAPLSFYDIDHGRRDGSPLRPWVEEKMREAGLAPDGGPIELLCYPRILGYVFNPLSVFFCRRRDGSLAALLYEVHNMHGEQHTYTLAVTKSSSVIRQSAEKEFYVSPFIGPAATYKFRIVPPGDSTSIVIRQESGGRLLMAASFHGTRVDLTTATVVRHLCAFPLLTIKVIAAIHWEAVKLWFKGFEIFPHTPRGAAQGKTEQRS